MAAPQRRRKRAPPSPRWQRWLQSQTVKWGLIVTAFGLASFAFGTTRDLVITAWRHYTGSELAHELAPEVQALRGLTAQQAALTTQTVERIDANEARLVVAEKTLKAAQTAKAIEQERQGAVETAQRAACLTGELAADSCHRLGYPTEQR